MDWFRVEVERVIEESPIDRSLVLTLPEGRAPTFRFRPGQYIQLRQPEGEGGLKGVYSLSSGPSDLDVEVTVRALGEAGVGFARLGAGAALEITMPRGNHPLDGNTEEEPPDEGMRRRVLIAQGAGVAPLRSYVRQLREVGHDGDVTLIQSDDDEAHLLFRAEFERHADECRWFQYVPTTAPVDAAFLEDRLKPPHRTVVFAVGATAFVDPVLETVHALGVPMDNIQRERWG